MTEFANWLKRLRAQFIGRELIRIAVVLVLFIATLLVVTAAAQQLFQLSVLSKATLDTIVVFSQPSGWLFWCLCLVVVACWILVRRLPARLAQINDKNLLLHINRNVPECEESAHLLLIADSQLNSLQQLQKHKVGGFLGSHYEDLCAKMANLYSSKVPLWHLLLSVFVAASLFWWVNTKQEAITNVTASNQQQDRASTQLDKVLNDTPRFSILVEPPRYTKLKPWTTDELSLEVPQGSQLTWQVSSATNKSFLLAMNQQSPVRFIQQPQPKADAQEVSWQLSMQIDSPSLYTLKSIDINNEDRLSDIQTINVIRDQIPIVEFIQPTKTVTEYLKSTPRTAISSVNTEVLVEDDYGFNDVYIMASIAKGTGEAVKFRDETFQFDGFTVVETEGENASITRIVRRYQKSWDLIALNMEPGDELYFSVVAIDNREPAAQVFRSQTKIIKWLDDDVVGINADGILMDFIPEYFKSQRQIIIETTELIAQKDRISRQQFEQTSRSLALSQADLKQRYGQYLGDEFESGVMQTMESGPLVNLAADDEDSHDEHDHDDHGDHAGHDDHSEQRAGTANGLSGYDDVIERFGHNHGEADIGFISLKKGQFSPKVLMKQSIAQMWQAELFLHMADPLQALPFEQRALEFLNRARKAERVYVKRLGFKPPPVTEDRRYEGDLSEIKSLDSEAQIQGSIDIEAVSRRFLKTLTQVSTTDNEITDSDNSQIESLYALLNAEVESGDSTAEKLKVLASLQRLLLSQQWVNEACRDCLSEVQLYLLKRLQAPVAEPSKPNYPINKLLADDYIQRLNAQQVPNVVR